MVSAQTDEMVAKLTSVDSELAAQEAQLMAQFQVIQEKRQSLQSVIQTFGGHWSPMTVAHEDGQSVAFSGIEPELGSGPKSSQVAQATATTKQPTAPPTGQRDSGKKGKQVVQKPAELAPEAEASTIQQGQADDELPWQSYIRNGYRDLSLPKAVLQVLQQRPEGVVSVPEIIDAIFLEETPKSVRATIRTRLSNALSVGLKNQKWYRGKTGQYSISKAAARATS
ncbi:MAG: hypothetical protein VKK04_05625 [Synechococcales bacterium]|nr:hypothetical protein [Synechococcales bacterium]